MQKDIHFFVGQIIVSDQAPTVESFSALRTEEITTQDIPKERSGREVVTIEVIRKQVRENRYVGIYFEKGERYPYPEEVIDTAGQKPKAIKNPRSPDEIEMDEQLFVLVDTHSGRVFLSDQRRRNFIAQRLMARLNQAVFIKPLMAEKEFMQKIKEISQISFSVEPTLLNHGGTTIASKLAEEIYGFEADTAVLTMTYKRKQISEVMRRKVSELLKRRNEVENVTIVGRTNEKFESVFNLEEIVSKISMRLNVDTKTQRFSPDNVFDALILKIENA